MQRMVLSWKDERTRQTAADFKAANAALIVGGGQTRSTGVRVGSTHFATHHRDVPAKLEELANALSILTARTDLSAVAKAGWAGVQFISLHPFADGNGRIARALVNLFLARGGLPFAVGFAASDTQRDAYRSALIDCHKLGISRPFAAIVSASVHRGWAALNALWASAKGPAAAAATAIGRSLSASALRLRARGDLCMICLDGLPNCTLLCCGGIFHVRCLGRWLNDSNRRTCPQCRAHVSVAEELGPGRAHQDDGGVRHQLGQDELRDLSTGIASGWLDVATTAAGDDTTPELEADDTVVEAAADDTEAEPGDDTELGTTAADDDTTSELEADDTAAGDDTEAAPESDSDDTEEDDDYEVLRSLASEHTGRRLRTNIQYLAL